MKFTFVLLFLSLFAVAQVPAFAHGHKTHKVKKHRYHRHTSVTT